ncbi:MAG: DUF3857 domain-containing protein [Verrucomicrobiota bacterium]
MNIWKSLILLFCLGCCALWMAEAHSDMIVLRNGREYQGRLVDSDGEAVRFRVEGETRRYLKDEVVHIRLQKQRRWSGAETAAEIDDAKLQEALGTQADTVQQTGAGTLTLHRNTTVTLDSAKTWTTRRREIVRILNEHGEDASIRSFTFHRDAEEARILHGISVRPDGKVVHLRDTAIQVEFPHQRFPRYDSMVAWRCALPEGKPGTTLDFEYQVDRTSSPHDLPFSGEYRFGGVDPMRDVSVRIVTTPDLPLRWEILNDAAESVTHEREQKEGRVIHTWTRDESPRLTLEPRMPPLADLVPRLVVSAETASWAELAEQGETRIVEAIASQDVPALPEKVAPAVESVWGFVSRAISENSVPVSAAGFSPGKLNRTVDLRQGAPLDRTALLFAWLRAHLDQPVRWCWIRPREDGELAEGVPRLDGFHTPAVAVGEGEDRRIVVLGDGQAAFGEPRARLGGAVCLVPGVGLQDLSLPDADWRGRDRRVRVQLDAEGTAIEEDQLICRGPAAKRFRKWRGMTREQIRNDVQKRIRDRFPTAADITWETEDDWTLNSAEFAITFHYRVPAIAHVHQEVVSLKAPWFDYKSGVVGRDSRSHPLFWQSPMRDTVRVEVTSEPEGKSWRHIPDTVDCAVSAKPDRPAGEGGVVLSAERTREPNRAAYQVQYQRTAVDFSAEQYLELKNCLQRRARIGQKYWLALP